MSENSTGFAGGSPDVGITSSIPIGFAKMSDGSLRTPIAVSPI